MDASGFDRLTRALTIAPSRRGIVHALAGTALGGLLVLVAGHDTSAKQCKKTCGRCKRCNRKTGECKPRTGPCGTCRRCKKGKCVVENNGVSCGTDKICRNGVCCTPCGDACCRKGELCADAASSACRIGRGSCKVGDDICSANQPIPCGPAGGSINNSCACFTSKSGATRCGDSTESSCGQCTTDEECETGFGLGAFCINDTGAGCLCATGEGFCAKACPS